MKLELKELDIVINGITKIRNKLSLKNEVSKKLDEDLKDKQISLTNYKMSLIKE